LFAVIHDFTLLRAVSEAIESAKEVVFIEDWWLVMDYL
jgi:hypothetical protein